MKEWGTQNVSQVGSGVGEALKYPLLLFSASVETLPRIREAEIIVSPPVSHVQAPCYQALTVLTQSWSSDYWSSKRERANLR